MSLEILEQAGTTTYAPIRTTIDGDRDYLRGDRQHYPGDVSHLSGLARCNCGYQGLDGTYQDGTLPPGMLGGLPGNPMAWVIGGVFVAWALWAMATPVETYGGP